MSGVASFVGEVVELKLHQHQQPVEAVAVAEDGASRGEPVSDGVQVSVEARGADDVAAFAPPLRWAAVPLCSDGVVPAVNPGTDLGEDWPMPVGRRAELLPAMLAVDGSGKPLPDAVAVGVRLGANEAQAQLLAQVPLAQPDVGVGEGVLDGRADAGVGVADDPLWFAVEGAQECLQSSPLAVWKA